MQHDIDASDIARNRTALTVRYPAVTHGGIETKLMPQEFLYWQLVKQLHGRQLDAVAGQLKHR